MGKGLLLGGVFSLCDKDARERVALEPGDLGLSTSLACNQPWDLRPRMAFLHFRFLSCTCPQGRAMLKVEQVYKAPNAGPGAWHTLPGEPLSSFNLQPRVQLFPGERRSWECGHR